MRAEHQRIWCHIRDDPHELGDISYIWLTEYSERRIESIDSKVLYRNLESLLSESLAILHTRERVEIRDEYSGIIALSCLSEGKYCSHEIAEMERWTGRLDAGDDLFHKMEDYRVNIRKKEEIAMDFLIKTKIGLSSSPWRSRYPCLLCQRDWRVWPHRSEVSERAPSHRRQHVHSR